MPLMAAPLPPSSSAVIMMCVFAFLMVILMIMLVLLRVGSDFQTGHENLQICRTQVIRQHYSLSMFVLDIFFFLPLTLKFFDPS